MADNGGEAYDPKKDPKRRAKSKDPGWKYAYWPTEDKNVVECLLCGKIVSSGIKRMKQHLLGGYGDVLVCEKTTTEIKKEMQAWIDKKRRKMPVEVDDIGEEDEGGDQDHAESAAMREQASQASCTGSRATKESTPSFGTASKRKAAAATFFKPAPTKQLKIAPLLLKSPDEIVRMRHAPGAKQQSLFRSGKSDAERHVAVKYTWSTFERIHSKKRNKLGHSKLDDLSYISFNSKIQERFARLHHEGNKVNPLFLEEFQWDNEWVDKDAEVVQRVHVDDDLTWDQVDASATTSSSLLRRNQPRGGNFYTRRAPQNVDELDQDPFICDDEDVDDDVVGAEGTQSQPDGGEDNEVDGENSDALEYDDDDV